MFQVYILQSLKDNRTYVGHTDNLPIRLRQHNAGQVTATKNRRPLKLIYVEKCSDSIAVKSRELYWKSGGGRRRLQLYFKKGFPPIEDGRGAPR